MRAWKVDVARSATFDDTGAQEFSEFHESFHHARIAAGLFGDDERIIRAGEERC